MKSHHFECWVQKFENTLWVQLNIYVADSVLTVLAFVLDFGLLGVKVGGNPGKNPFLRQGSSPPNGSGLGGWKWSFWNDGASRPTCLCPSQPGVQALHLAGVLGSVHWTLLSQVGDSALCDPPHCFFSLVYCVLGI